MNSISRGLLSHVGASAKTGLADSQMESMHPKLLNVLGSFLGPIAKSNYVPY
jgi:hypothetical protein